MSRIFPASGKKVDWSPDIEVQIKKEAQGFQDGVIEVAEEVDPVLDALQGVPTLGEQVGELLDKAKDVLEEANAAVEAIEGAESKELKGEEIPAEEPKAEEPKAEEAPVSEEAEEVEIEIPSKDEADEIEIEIKEESPAEESKEEEIEKESGAACAEAEPEIKTEAKAEKAEEKKAEGEDEKEEEADMAKNAAHDLSKLVHVAKLSKQNKEDLRKYWKDMLGFPPEYVDAMLKD